MILQKDNNIFTDKELFSLYEKLHTIYKGLILIQFLYEVGIKDDNGNYYWIGTIGIINLIEKDKSQLVLLIWEIIGGFFLLLER